MVDGTKQNSMPTSPMGKNNKYYQVDVSCGSSETEGNWDYNAWRLNLDYIESNSKCNLTFTSTMSKAEYDEYIKSGVALRRNTYRGKDITKYKDLPESDPMNLYNQINNGTFADIYVGDYINGSKGVTWLVADLDYYLNRGTPKLSSHNVTIIPANNLGSARMNETDTTEGGYANSEMVTKTLNEVLDQYIKPDFEGHILTYYAGLSTGIKADAIGSDGQSSGATTTTDMFPRQLDLMNDVSVLGYIAATTYRDIGQESQQYAIFRLRPGLIFEDLNGNGIFYNFSSIFSKNRFNGICSSGGLCPIRASAEAGIRPKFLIGKVNN